MKIALGKLWTITKQHQKLWSTKTEDGHIEKHRKRFTSYIIHLPVWSSSDLRGIPLEGHHPVKKRSRTPGILITTTDICSFC